MLGSLLGFIEFLKSAFFMLGYIQNSNLFPEPLTPEEKFELFENFE